MRGTQDELPFCEAKCPCFLSAERKEVRCKGLQPDSCLVSRFRRRQDAVFQYETYCNGLYGYCELYIHNQQVQQKKPIQ